MAKLQKSIIIHAPIEKVFNFMNDPLNLPDIWPSMIDVRDVTPAPGGGYNFGWVYKMAGIRFEGASDTTEYVVNQRTVTQSTKGIESKFIWMYETINKDSKITVDIEYNVPMPVLGKLAETVIMKQNEHEAEILLDNLKNRMEVETPIRA